MVWLIFLLLLLSPAGEAQTQRKKKTAAPKPAPAVEQMKFPIEALRLEGNKRYSAGQVFEAAGLKVGQEGGKEVFDAARQRLFDTGVFEDVGYRYEPGPGGRGYAVTFEVAELEQIYPFRIEELPGDPAELRAAVTRWSPLLGEEIPATKGVLDRSVKAVEEHLAKAGHEVKVSGSLLSDGPGELVIIFRQQGLLPAVATIRFKGNSAIPESRLQKAIYGVAVGLPYTEKRFRTLLDTSVRPLYEAQGLVEVAFPRVETEKSEKVDGLNVTVTVEEGQAFDLGEVLITGVPEAQGLRKIFAVKSGEVVNFEEVEAGRQRIHQSLRRQGYLKVDSTIERRVEPTDKLVNLTIDVQPGPVYQFGKLILVGLDLLSEPEVRRIWAMKQGEPFDAGYPDFFLSEIEKRGVFDNLKSTKASVKLNDEARTVEVTLSFNR